MNTFWTPFGKYRFRGLPFGISQSSEIFHRKQKEILTDLKDVKVIANDISVYGSEDTEQPVLQFETP